MESPTNEIFQSHIYQRLQLADVRLYCVNNPVNIIDPTGMELKFTGGTDDHYKYERFS